MTYIVKHSGSGGLIVASYRCVECGLFDVIAERVNGSAPVSHPCDCGLDSPWTPSAPKMRVDTVVPTAAIRGGDMKDRPPGMLSTRSLGEGGSMKDWKAAQNKLREERRHQKMIKLGLHSPRVQVGGGTK